MNGTRMDAGYKINLFLEVCECLSNGYHRLDTVYLRLYGGDALYLRHRSAGGLVFSLEGEDIVGETTLHRAYKLVCHFLGVPFGVHVHLKKKIPIGSGLGGGSADAASFLRWSFFNTALQSILSWEDLQQESLKIGADVPFFMASAACMRGQGVGEILDEIKCSPTFKSWACLVIFSPPGISTRASFSHIDRQGLPAVPSSPDKLIHALREGICSGEPLVMNRFEGILNVRDGAYVRGLSRQLYEAGAMAAGMTGTGRAVYGLFPSQVSADRARAFFSSDASLWMHVSPVSPPQPLC